jgi:hypothetical protein
VGLDARSESPAEEKALETPKSPEQSQNVIENKGPAAEKCVDEAWCGRPARCGTGILPVPIHRQDGRATIRGQNLS